MTTTSTPHTEATMEDIPMLPPTPPFPHHTVNQPIPSQCAIFQSRIDSYKRELNCLETENEAINLKLCSLEQEGRRDRLIDSASPEQRSAEPRVEVQEETKETKEMMVKKVKERKRMLRCQLDRIKEGMEAMKAEMEWVKKEVDVLGQ